MRSRNYLIGLLLAVIVLTINQLYIQQQISAIVQDASIINLAGKQRMLSQRISLEYHQLFIHQGDTAQLSQLFQEWESVHARLLKNRLVQESVAEQGNPDLLGRLSNKITRAHEFREMDLTQLETQLAVINQNQEDFLIEMDQLVMYIEIFSETKLSRLRIVEVFLYLISILLIVFELFWVFRPIERKLKTNLTFLRHRNLELRRLNQALHTKNQEIKAFNYVTSHDLQEPLRTVASYASLLRKKYHDQLDELGKQSLLFMQEASQRMIGQIKSLLQHSLIGKNQRKEQIKVQQTLDTVLEDLQQLIQEQGAVLKTESLPTIKALPFEFKLLLQNLISNAIKYQAPDRPPEIEITYKESETHHHFQVIDNGMGIPPRFHHKVFEIFQRLNKTDSPTGSGIGLAHCKKIVQLHQGEIWIEDNQPHGSRFCFTVAK